MFFYNNGNKITAGIFIAIGLFKKARLVKKPLKGLAPSFLIIENVFYSRRYLFAKSNRQGVNEQNGSTVTN